MNIKTVCLIECILCIWLKVWGFLQAWLMEFARFYWNVWKRAVFDPLKGVVWEKNKWLL